MSWSFSFPDLGCSSYRNNRGILWHISPLSRCKCFWAFSLSAVRIFGHLPLDNRRMCTVVSFSLQYLHRTERVHRDIALIRDGGHRLASIILFPQAWMVGGQLSKNNSAPIHSWAGHQFEMSTEHSLLSYFVSIVWQAVRENKIWGVFSHPQVAVSVDWSIGRWIVS